MRKAWFIATGQALRFSLSNIPDFEGVKLSASIELASVTEQAIRNSLAEWEAAVIGISPAADESLEIQHTYLRRQRKELLNSIATLKLSVIDVDVADDERSKAQVKQLNLKIDSLLAELKTIERKLEVIKEAIENEPK